MTRFRRAARKNSLAAFGAAIVVDVDSCRGSRARIGPVRSGRRSMPRNVLESPRVSTCWARTSSGAT